MQVLVEENQQQAARNEALRKRIQQLRKERRLKENKRLKLLEDALWLSQDEPLDTQDYDVEEAERKILAGRRERLSRGRENLQRQINGHGRRQELLTDNIVMAEQKGKLLQEGGAGEALPQANRADQQKRRGVDGLIGQAKGPVAQRKTALRGKRQGRKRGNRQQEASLLEKSRIQNEQQAVLKELQRQLLGDVKVKADIKKQRARQEEAVSELRQQIAALKDYRTALQSSRDGMQRVGKETLQQSRQQMRHLENRRTTLKQERQLLIQKREVLRHTAALRREGVSPGSGDVGLDEELAGRIAARDTLVRQVAENQRALSLADQNRQALSQDNRQIEKELVVLQDRIVDKKKKRRQSAEGALQKKRLEFQQEVQSRQRALAAAEERVAGLNRQILVLQEQKRGVLNRTEKLLNEYSQTQEQLALQKAQEGQLRKDIEVSGRRKTQTREQLTQEVEDLQRRSALLSSAFSVIHSRFAAEDLVVQEFQGEEQGLREYLVVLQEENLSLRDKQVALREALARSSGRTDILVQDEKDFSDEKEGVQE